MLVYQWPDTHIKLWPHFSVSEMECKCGCGALPSSDLMIMLEQLRDRCDFPLYVTSGARCPTHNDKESTTGRTGPHTTGLAVDIAVSHDRAWIILDQAYRMGGWYGIGDRSHGTPRWIHLDRIVPGVDPNNPRPRKWSYP